MKISDYDEIAFLMFEFNDPELRKRYKPMYLRWSEEGKHQAVSHLSDAWLTSFERAKEVAIALNTDPEGCFIELKVAGLSSKPIPCIVRIIPYKRVAIV